MCRVKLLKHKIDIHDAYHVFLLNFIQELMENVRFEIEELKTKELKV